MRLSLTTSDGHFQSVEVDPDMELMNLKALAEVEVGIASDKQILFHNGQPLQNDSSSLRNCGLKEDDLILVESTANIPSPAEQARQQILNNPQLRAQLTQRNPAMAQALQDPVMFERVYNEMQKHAKDAQERQSKLQSADPFDIEAQRQIEEEIRKQNIAQNYEKAIEHNPEFFGRVVMLYINVEVNGVPVKAFVDSGAQATIMSPSCAERTNVLKILDERFSGVATGVGTAKILGRIHSTMIKVGKQFLPVSISVMEGKDVDLLFGLDVLKRHQACIDLKANCLRINDEDIPFLPEHEIPDAFKEKSLPPDQTASPQPQTQLSQPAPAASSSSSQPKFSETQIKALTDLGATRQSAIEALTACNGNVDMAANMIFQL